MSFYTFFFIKYDKTDVSFVVAVSKDLVKRYVLTRWANLGKLIAPNLGVLSEESVNLDILSEVILVAGVRSRGPLEDLNTPSTTTSLVTYLG
jgi:hypothetical protein